MINSHLSTPIESNEESLKTLMRTLQLSQGQFSLILLQCNYLQLQRHLTQKIQDHFSLHEIIVPASVKTLYTMIKAELIQEQPTAVMVSGLETVRSIDQVLISANQVREDFRKSFPFPLLLWVNDKIAKKLIRLVPDIESWSTTYQFTMTADELIDFLAKSADTIFTTVLELGACKFLPNPAILNPNCATELQSAYQELQNLNIQLETALIARLQFVLGRHYYAHHQIQEALQHYQESLQEFERLKNPQQLWSTLETFEPVPPDQLFNDLPILIPPSHYQIEIGVVLFHLGLCYCHLAENQPTESQQNWQAAKNYIQQCLEVFKSAHRLDLVAKFINQLGMILQHLKDWDELWELAKQSRQLHQEQEGNCYPVQLAQDYGFLAAVKLHQYEWQEAKELAQVALDIIAAVEKNQHSIFNIQHQGLYLLILAKAQSQLYEQLAAIKNLERAKTQTDAQYNPQLYLQILQQLHELYFQEENYRTAFQIKQVQREIEVQYGFRAFIGAGRLQPQRQTIHPQLEPIAAVPTIADEIKASGREQDINQLIERMSSNYHKLTIIYGQSGVGKSSIVTAGLVPELKHRIIGARNVVPLVLQVYRDWGLSTGDWAEHEILFDAAEELSIGNWETVEIDNHSTTDPSFKSQNQIGKLLKQFRQNADNNLLTVLIFDQFEEFFFVCKNPEKRQEFFDFLRECLNLPFVKVILSLREDYIYYLLEFSRFTNLDIIDNDILNKNNLCYLGNLSKINTFNVIKTLTERSHFSLEESLIQQLVEDLAGESNEVRPIELQVVGTQLQELGITTFHQYQQLGPKPKQTLVEQFVQEVVKDCGPSNEETAHRVLYSLIDEDNTRPLKSRAELAIELEPFKAADQLDLVLEILVASGLVFRWQEASTELYQLVHDYLADFIRQQLKLDERAELKELRERHKESQEQIEKLTKEQALLLQLKESQEKERKVREQMQQQEQTIAKKDKKSLQLGVAVTVIAAIVFAALALTANDQRRRAERAEDKALMAETTALTSASKALVISRDNDQLGILLTSVRIGKSAQSKSPEIKKQIAEELRQAVSEVQELNRLGQHEGSVLGVSFSPDGKWIASASLDKTVKIWSNKGELLTVLNHPQAVTSLSFSPNSTMIATASANGQVKLWSVKEGKEIATVSAHNDIVLDVSFSPDGKVIATASADKTVKLWPLDRVSSGQPQTTLIGHADWVYRVSFSPDGKTIASASQDGTVKLWNPNGRFLKTLQPPRNTNSPEGNPVYSVSFSPDGKTIAAAYGDNTVRLWKLDANSEPKVLKGHSGEVRDVNFSSDGQTLVSASADKTVKLWSREGALLNTFTGHQGIVRGVSFSADGQTIASASDDNTVRLWSPNSTPLREVFADHRDWVYHAKFSPNGKRIASASYDQTVKLWDTEGNLLQTLNNPNGALTWLSFSPDGTMIAAASQDNTVKLWNQDGKLLQTFQGHTQPVFGVSFSRDGKLIASGSEDKTVKLWRLDGTLVTTLRHNDGVNYVDFSPNGEIIASASADKTVKLWSKTGTLLKTLPHNESVDSLSFSPDGKKIATAAGKTVQLWDVNGVALNVSLNHNEDVTSIAFSPSGQIIATSAGKIVTFWGLDGKPLTTLHHSDVVQSVSFSPDGQTIVLASNDKTVILWRVDNLDLESLIARGCEWLQGYLQYNPSIIQESDRSICVRIH